MTGPIQGRLYDYIIIDLTLTKILSLLRIILIQRSHCLPFFSKLSKNDYAVVLHPFEMDSLGPGEADVTTPFSSTGAGRGGADVEGADAELRRLPTLAVRRDFSGPNFDFLPFVFLQPRKRGQSKITVWPKSNPQTRRQIPTVPYFSYSILTLWPIVSLIWNKTVTSNCLAYSI